MNEENKQTVAQVKDSTITVECAVPDTFAPQLLLTDSGGIWYKAGETVT